MERALREFGPVHEFGPVVVLIVNLCLVHYLLVDYQLVKGTC